MVNDNILRITTGETIPVEIDGKKYQLKSQHDLSLSIQHRLVRLHTRLAAMEKSKSKRSDKAWEAEYESLDTQMVNGICSLFTEQSEVLRGVIKKLGINQRVKVFDAVFKNKVAEEKKTPGKTTT